MRSGSLLLAMMMFAGTARAAGWGGCPPGDYARSQAECITDQMAPDAIDKLYRLALSTVDGKLDPDNVPSDFLYIAEEAGEAARLKSPKPLLEMAGSSDISKIVFAARAMTNFVDSVEYGWSHRRRFDGKGDAKLYAEAQRIFSAPCKRLAAQEGTFLQAEGKRCLNHLTPVRSLPPPEEIPVPSVHDIGDGSGGLGITDHHPGPGPAPPFPRSSKPKPTAVVTRSGSPAATAALKRVLYEGPIRALLEEDFADGKLRLLLTLRAHDLAGCGSLATRVMRAPGTTTIVIAGIDRDPASLMCALMEPPAPSARFDLTNEEGQRILTVRLGQRADDFALDVEPTEVDIAPYGKPAFVELKARGKMRRVPPNVMWVSLSYSDEAARKRFRPEADALVSALTAAGAKPIKLPAGKYAARFPIFASLDPHAQPSDDDPPPVEDTYFFQYEGTFDALAKIGERWKKYDRRHDKRGAYMSTHITDPHGRTFGTDQNAVEVSPRREAQTVQPGSHPAGGQRD